VYLRAVIIFETPSASSALPLNVSNFAFRFRLFLLRPEERDPSSKLILSASIEFSFEAISVARMKRKSINGGYQRCAVILFSRVLSCGFASYFLFKAKVKRETKPGAEARYFATLRSDQLAPRSSRRKEYRFLRDIGIERVPG